MNSFSDRNFGSFVILTEEDCEDRSAGPIEPELKSYQDEGLATLRLVNDNEEIQNLESPLFFCHRVLINSVADLLQEREILIVPDRSLNQVPFGALSDENGVYPGGTLRNLNWKRFPRADAGLVWKLFLPTNSKSVLFHPGSLFHQFF